ncbi:MAG: hypothetical protein M1382_02700 [Candidatus Marsarchaeota archaeon]|jgi:hypothetical protein|nr:hypothetical protein [Candidatus Marsarchaeota archaeon]
MKQQKTMTGVFRLPAIAKRVFRIILPFVITAMILVKVSAAQSASSGIISQITYIKEVLSQVGPALSALLFVLAGIFYAIGQILPYDKKANFHTTAINIIIGAVVVGVLSVASNTLATASTHLLSNFTNVSLNSS